MNRDFETTLTHIVIMFALIAFGYWLARLSPCPKTADALAPNMIDERNLNKAS